MKLSNVVIRVCYITALIYLCYITYHHIDILKVQFHKTLVENFIDTGSTTYNLLKETNLGAAFGDVSYSALIGHTWGTSEKDEESKAEPAPAPGSIVNFNFINSEVDTETPGVPTGRVRIGGAAIGTLSPDDVNELPSETETHIRESEKIDWSNWTYDSKNNRWHCSSDCFVTNTTRPPRTTGAPWCFDQTCATLDIATECDGAANCTWNTTEDHCSALPIACATTPAPQQAA